jgi:hypothetical protein
MTTASWRSPALWSTTMSICQNTSLRRRGIPLLRCARALLDQHASRSTARRRRTNSCRDNWSRGLLHSACSQTLGGWYAGGPALVQPGSTSSSSGHREVFARWIHVFLWYLVGSIVSCTSHPTAWKKKYKGGIHSPRWLCQAGNESSIIFRCCSSSEASYLSLSVVRIQKAVQYRLVIVRT